MTTTNVVQLSSITPHPSVEYWSVCKVEALFETPFLELVYRAAQVHREHFNPGAIQLSTLMSIKTGGCPEGSVVIAHNQHVIKQAYKISRSWILMKLLKKPKLRKHVVQDVFVWAQHGVVLSLKIWKK